MIREKEFLEAGASRTTSIGYQTEISITEYCMSSENCANMSRGPFERNVFCVKHDLADWETHAWNVTYVITMDAFYKM